MHDLTAFQRDLLYTIPKLESANGLQLQEKLQEYYDKEIHHGRIYPNLDDLVSKGLVEKGRVDARTNAYSLTRQGRMEVQDRIAWENRKLRGSEAWELLPERPADTGEAP